MTQLSPPQPNMSSIGEGCDSLGKTFLASLGGNLWATGGFWVNSFSGEGGLSIVTAGGECNIDDDT